MRYSIRFPVLSIVLLLVTVSPAQGQTLTYSLLGHERQVGPVEQCLVVPQRVLLTHTTTTPWAVQKDSIHYQPNIPILVVSGTVGAIAGLGAVVAFGQLFSNESKGFFKSSPRVKAIIFSSIILEPYGLASGVHLSNGSRSTFNRVYWASFGGFILGGLGALALAMLLPGDYKPLSVLAIPAVQLLKAIKAEIASTTSNLQIVGYR